MTNDIRKLMETLQRIEEGWFGRKDSAGAPINDQLRKLLAQGKRVISHIPHAAGEVKSIATDGTAKIDHSGAEEYVNFDALRDLELQGNIDHYDLRQKPNENLKESVQDFADREAIQHETEHWVYALEEYMKRKGVWDEILAAATDEQTLRDAIAYEASNIAHRYHDSGEGIGSSDINAFIANVAQEVGIKDVFGWYKESLDEMDELEEAKTITWLGIPNVKQAPPTRRHRPAIWEAMLGTVYAMSPDRKIKEFGYDREGAKEWAGIGPNSDPRFYRYVPKVRRQWGTGGGMYDITGPRNNQWTLWVVDSLDEAVVEVPAGLRGDDVDQTGQLSRRDAEEFIASMGSDDTPDIEVIDPESGEILDWPNRAERRRQEDEIAAQKTDDEDLYDDNYAPVFSTPRNYDETWDLLNELRNSDFYDVQWQNVADEVEDADMMRANDYDVDITLPVSVARVDGRKLDSNDRDNIKALIKGSRYASMMQNTVLEYVGTTNSGRVARFITSFM